MKKLLFCFLLLPFITSAQTPGQWTWMKGTGSVSVSAPVYGTMGVASPANTPGSLYESCEWTDSNGNFWIFGGLDPTGIEMGDLWKFDPVSTDWTWVKGPGIGGQAGVYGTKGIPNDTNQPGGRSYGMVSWLDNNGTFWMFGGYGYDRIGGAGYLNDLWSYDVNTNQWTWVSGSNIKNAPGMYGTKGVPSPSNVPPTKSEIATGWTDANGNLWIFGGQNISLYYNDLWKYNIATNEWTWMRGDSVSGSLGNYGLRGMADPANDPPSRYIYAKWKDAFGNFWMFAGTATTYGQMNDMWKFDPLANQWTWVNGPNMGIDQGVTGAPCVGDATYRPASRYENRAVWTDACGNFYNFGGYHVTGLFSMSTIDDLWQYNPVKNQWKFINGGPDGSLGNFGILGVSSATNMPPGLCGSNSFTDAKGNFWLFGGLNNSVANAVNCVWRFVPDSTCSTCNAAVIAPPAANFLASDSNLCAYHCINFTNQSTNATSYQWTFSGGMPATSTDVNPQNICYLNKGIFSVTLIAKNSSMSDTLTFANYIHVIPSPATPNIIHSNDTLFCSYDTSYKSYQWYYDSTLIAGATKSFVIETQTGNYNVAVSNSSGCIVSAGIIIEGIQNFSFGKTIFISPNPAGDEFTVYGIPFTAGQTTIELYNVLGQIVAAKQPEHDNSNLATTIDVSRFSKGIYFVVIANDNRKWIGKLVKE